MEEGKTYRANFNGCANFIEFTGVIEHPRQGVLAFSEVGVFKPVKILSLAQSEDGLVRVLLMPHLYAIPLFEVDENLNAVRECITT